jgi:hypothetical protein
MVFIHKVIDDSPKIGFEIERIEGDNKIVRHTPCIGRIAGAATPLFVIQASFEYRQQRIRPIGTEIAGSARLLSVAHENTHKVITLFLQQMGRHTGVDTATHG